MPLEKGLSHKYQEIICYITARLNKLEESIRDKGLRAQRAFMHRFMSNEGASQAQYGFLPSLHNSKPSAALTGVPRRDKTNDRRLRK
jgi:hypothetical protein